MRHASLFSGIGGPEVAAAMLGWENVFHCEINPFGRKVLEYWFPESDSYEDITKTDFTRYRGKIDVLTGGFPCQPFSYAGKRKGENDDRYLWQEMLKVVDQVRPMWVISENVNGITTMVESYSVTKVGCETSLFNEGSGIHRYRAEHTFERVCRDLESKGYSVQPMLIPACAVGTFHQRDRIFILAYNVADTNCVRGDKVHEYIQSEFADGAKSVSNGGINDAPNSEGLFVNGSEVRYGGDDVGQEVSELGGRDCQDASDSKSQQGNGCGVVNKPCKERQKQLGRIGGESIARMLPEKRWQGFPSVSPVHRGNDGLPFDVDNLSIPFAKWRAESLKAYGNAIVPQVMYRIFQCIEKVSYDK